jgi:peptide/nickel transport system permease protein
VLRQDYVRTAWAKGLKMRAVILKHALRNALIPLITILALALPGLVQGALITEQVFNYTGMGFLYIQAVQRLDFPLAMAFLMIITLLTILANMLADVLYAVVDPRIRYS